MLTRQKQVEYKEQVQVTVRKEVAGQNWRPQSPLLSLKKWEKDMVKRKRKWPKARIKNKTQFRKSYDSRRKSPAKLKWVLALAELQIGLRSGKTVHRTSPSIGLILTFYSLSLCQSVFFYYHMPHTLVFWFYFLQLEEQQQQKILSEINWY